MLPDYRYTTNIQKSKEHSIGANADALLNVKNREPRNKPTRIESTHIL